MTIPFTCVDDFYKNPDEIKNWALTLPYAPSKKGFNFPGERTANLNLIDSDFFKFSCGRILSIFYDINLSQIKEYECETYFQKTYSFHPYYDSPMNSGWAHIDDNCVFAGVIYLNKNPSLNSGTSILQPKKEHDYLLKDSSALDEDYIPRNKLYNNEEICVEDYVKNIQEHNNKFDVCIDVKNNFNRLICYNGSTWHRESNFCMENEEFRLTQVFFFTYLKATESPILRLNKQ